MDIGIKKLIVNTRFLRLAAVAGSLLFACGVSASGEGTQDAQIAPPKISLTDDYGVNILTGQVSVSQETVSIGGDLGLSHSISLYTNHFSQTRGRHGYTDKFAGNVRYVKLGEYVDIPHGSNHLVYVMRVFGPMGTQDFQVYAGGQYRNAPGGGKFYGSYRFEPIGDSRHELEKANNDGDLVWTTPDGTELFYERGGSHARASGFLRKITYPNGFELDIATGGVSTNTGYLLKYRYNGSWGGLSSSKRNILNGLPSNHQIPTAGSFKNYNPGEIVAVNLAEEYCTNRENHNCSFNEEWPTAHFDWPGGMPRAAYLGRSTFTVENAKGQKAKYYYKSFDVMVRNNGEYGGEVSPGNFTPYSPREKWSPRLVGVQSVGAKEKTVTYEYKTEFTLAGSGSTSYYKLVSETGIVKSASGTKGDVSYPRSPMQGGGEVHRASWPYGEYRVTPNHQAPGTIDSATVPKVGKVYYEKNYRNFVTSENRMLGPGTGPAKSYEYERGNIKKVSLPDGNKRADYPNSCTSDNRKYCNKPKWVEDARGNRTNYQYHKPSGQVKKVTGPPDPSGDRPQTRYKYDKFYAYYKKDGNSVEKADSGVWLPVEKSQCQTSSPSGSGCSGSGDEVVTEYDYGPQNGSPNNLNMVKKTVRASGETRVTCYQYDQYGRKIGETQPRANSSQCPQ